MSVRRSGMPVELAPYLDELIESLSAVATLHAVYLIGSAALGAYERWLVDRARAALRAAA